jgi:hypothetical protein
VALPADKRMRGTLVPRSSRGKVLLGFLRSATIVALWGTLLTLAAVFMNVRGADLHLSVGSSALAGVLPVELPGQIFLAVGIGVGIFSIMQSDAHFTLSALRRARGWQHPETE